MEEFFLARGPSYSAEVRGLVIHDIKEVGVRQQEEQEDKRDEETGDEMKREVCRVEELGEGFGCVVFARLLTS